VAREAHDETRSVVLLPGAFLDTVLTETDSHQWFPSYFARHAIALSDFS
jgi:hypothetical protein